MYNTTTRWIINIYRLVGNKSQWSYDRQDSAFEGLLKSEILGMYPVKIVMHNNANYPQLGNLKMYFQEHSDYLILKH